MVPQAGRLMRHAVHFERVEANLLRHGVAIEDSSEVSAILNPPPLSAPTAQRHSR
jgi:hypothetical protein